MSYYTLPKSGLRMLSSTGAAGGDAEGQTDWNTQFDYNMTRLNSTLLKLKALLDVNAAGINTGDVLTWDAATSKWIKYTPQKPPL